MNTIDSLVSDLVSAAIRDGKLHDVLPEGRRADYEELFARLVVDRDSYLEYTEILCAELRRRGLSQAGLDVKAEGQLADGRDEAVARDGPSILSDAELAGLLLGTFNLLTFVDYMQAMEETGATGVYWFEAVCRDSQRELEELGQGGLAEEVARAFMRKVTNTEAP